MALSDLLKQFEAEYNEAVGKSSDPEVVYPTQEETELILDQHFSDEDGYYYVDDFVVHPLPVGTELDQLQEILYELEHSLKP